MSFIREATNNLITTKEILDSLGILFWLDFGTLLGAYRDNNFCKDDETDIDLGTLMANKHRADKYIELMQLAGFKLYKRWEYKNRYALEISMCRDNVKVDLFFYNITGQNAWCCIYGPHAKTVPVVIPKDLIQNLSKYKFKSKLFNIPTNINAFLTAKYGDWQTPVHRDNWCYYSSDKAMKDSFDGLLEE